MTTVISRPFKLNVIDPSSSPLRDTINGTGASGYSTPMATDSWRQHLTAANMLGPTGVGDISGCVPNSQFPFMNTMPWNSLRKRIEILGGGHPQSGLPPGAQAKCSYTFYSELGNTGPSIDADSFLRCGNFWYPLDVSYTGTHGYNHVAINPFTGDMYQRAYGGGVHDIKIIKRLIDAPADLPASYTYLLLGPVINGGVANAIWWWSGSFTPSGGGGIPAGAQGCLMHFSSDVIPVSSPTNGQICAYNPVSNQWFYNQNSRAPGGGGDGGNNCNYHQIGTYSPTKNCAVYGGGNYDYQEFWKMSSDGTVISMPNTSTLSGASGKGSAAGSNTGRFCFDPASGGFALFDKGETWVLNPDGTGQWTRKADQPLQVNNVNHLICAIPLPDHGVIAVLVCDGNTSASFWLFKSS